MNMSSEYFKETVRNEVTAVVGETFKVFHKTVVGYKEEIDRPGGHLHTSWSPQLKLHRIDCPVHVCKEEEEEVPADQQLCKQEMDSSVGQEEAELPQVKKEEEEPCTIQEGERLVLKQETGTFMLTPTYEENDRSEDQTLCMKAGESAAQKESVVNTPVVISVVGAANSDQRHLTMTNDLTRLMRIHTGEKPYRCETCGEYFRQAVQLKRHMRIHTGEKPYRCETCGELFRHDSTLTKHMRIHTGKKPYGCEICRKHFRQSDALKQHMRIHTGEKPYRCKTCGEHFRHQVALTRHMRIHTGEKPYGCKTCGEHFRQSGTLKQHMRIHTGEKPYRCEICRRHFRRAGTLKQHMRIHTGEKPYRCKTCGEHFRQQNALTYHMRIHTDEKP